MGNINVSTLGGRVGEGKGEFIGGRAIITLRGQVLFTSVSLGIDYKHSSTRKCAWDCSETFERPIFLLPLPL